MRDFDVIALDIETSGVGEKNPVYTKSGEKFALLSIGCVRLSDLETFYGEAKHREVVWSASAGRIHGLDANKLDADDKLTIASLDQNLFDWLKSDVFYKEGKKYTLIPMGLNVGSFDMAFVKEWLPKTSNLFGYRSLDLNSLLFVEAATKEGGRFPELKAQALAFGETIATTHFGSKARHNALYDAWVHLGMFSYLTNVNLEDSVGHVQWEGGNLK